MDTIQKWAEAKRSGLNNNCPSMPEAKVGETVTMPIDQYEDLLSNADKNNEIFERQQEPNPWLVWGQVALTMLCLVASIYIIWLLHQRDPKAMAMFHFKEAQTWAWDQGPKQKVARTIYKVKPVAPQKPQRRPTFEEKYKLSQLRAFQNLQYYIVDRFFDTPLPPGQKRELLVCQGDGGCKSYVLPDKVNAKLY